MNKWRKTIKYINSKKIGTTFSRYDMQKNVSELFYSSPYYNTADNYRKILSKLNILEHVSIGNYKILYHIRQNLSLRQAKKAAYSDNWRKWFNDFKMD